MNVDVAMDVNVDVPVAAIRDCGRDDVRIL
jgi:hypothetical protein